MKRVKKGVFLVRKRSCTTFSRAKIRKIREKRGKIRKTWLMTKKGHQKFLPLKWKFFQKKSSSWSAKNFSVPPNSAPGFRPWLQMQIDRHTYTHTHMHHSDRHISMQIYTYIAYTK